MNTFVSFLSMAVSSWDTFPIKIPEIEVLPKVFQSISLKLHMRIHVMLSDKTLID